MRHAPVFALLLVIAACGDRTAPADPSPPVREHPLAQDGSTERAITSTPDRVKVQLDLANARAAVQAFKVEKGSYPQSLAELSLDGLNYPADLTYDPDSGRVGSQTYPTY